MNNVTHHHVTLRTRLRLIVRHHRLQVALTAAICVALSLVCISVYIYTTSGFSRYDLSRPGYEKERQEVAKPVEQKTYDTTGTITAATLDEFLREFDGRVRDITAYGAFKDSSLGDEDLGIQAGPESNTAPQ